MSSLAIMLKNLGYKVMGSDIDLYTFTMDNLIKNNITILNYDLNNLKDDYIYIVQSENNSIEAKYVKENYKYLYYYEFIAKFKKDINIAVSGTHGKTTTTSILAHIFKDCNYIIGNSYGHGNIKSNMFIYEACEYKDHFLNYYPDISIILNVEMDHVDYFKSYKDLYNSFVKFSKNSKVVIYNGDSLKLDGISFGYNKNNDYIIKDDTIIHNDKIYKINYKAYSKNMMYDICACYVLCDILKTYDFNELIKGFNMPKRRFNEIIYKNHIFIDDYAHHPSEIKNVIEMTKNKYKKDIIILFQPHQYERLVYFKDEFYDILKEYETYIIDLFNARSDDEHNIDFFIKEPLKRFDEFKLKSDDKVIIYASAGYDIKKIFEKI